MGERGSDRMASTDDLGKRLLRTLEVIHPEPSRVQTDEPLRQVLRRLYSDLSDDEVWRDIIIPYVRDHADGLRNVYCEHRVNPSWLLLDAPEVLLVFERADHDRERLRQCWPGSSSELDRIGDVWGVAL